MRCLSVLVMLAIVGCGPSSDAQKAAELEAKLAEAEARHQAEITALREERTINGAAISDGADDQGLTVDDFFLPFSREELERKSLIGWEKRDNMADIGFYSYVKEFGLTVNVSETYGRIGKLEITFDPGQPSHVEEARKVLTTIFAGRIDDAGFHAMLKMGKNVPDSIFAPMLTIGKSDGYFVFSMAPHNVAFSHSQKSKD